MKKTQYLSKLLAVCTLGFLGTYATNSFADDTTVNSNYHVTFNAQDPVLWAYNPNIRLSNLSNSQKALLASQVCNTSTVVSLSLQRKLREIDSQYRNEVDPRKALRAKVRLLKPFMDRINKLQPYFDTPIQNVTNNDLRIRVGTNSQGVVQYVGGNIIDLRRNTTYVLANAQKLDSSYFLGQPTIPCTGAKKRDTLITLAELKHTYINLDKQLDPDEYHAKEFADTAMQITHFALNVEHSMSYKEKDYDSICSSRRRKDKDGGCDASHTIIRSLLILSDKQLKKIAESTPYGGIYKVDPKRYYLDRKTQKEYEDKIRQYQFDKLHQHYISLGQQVNQHLTDIFNKFAQKNNLNNVDDQDGGNFIYQMIVGKLLGTVMDKFNIYDDPKYLQDLVKSLVQTLKELANQAIKQAIPKPDFETVLKFLSGNLGSNTDVIKDNIFQKTYENILKQGKEKTGEKQKEVDYKKQQQNALEKLNTRQISKTDKNTQYLRKNDIDFIQDNDFNLIYSMSKYYDKNNVTSPQQLQAIYSRLSGQTKNYVNTLKLICTGLYSSKETQCTQIALYYILKQISNSRYKNTLTAFKKKLDQLTVITTQTGSDQINSIKEFSNDNTDLNISPQEIDKIDESKGGNPYINSVIKSYIEQIGRIIALNEERYNEDQKILSDLGFRLTMQVYNINYDQETDEVKDFLRKNEKSIF